MNELHQAIIEGELDAVLPFLTQPDTINQPHTETGEYPLFIAALYEVDLIYYHLLDHGAHIPLPSENNPQAALVSFQYYFTHAYRHLSPPTRPEQTDRVKPDYEQAESNLRHALTFLNSIETKTDQDYRYLEATHLTFIRLYHEQNQSEMAIEHGQTAILHNMKIQARQDEDEECASLLYHLCADEYQVLFMRETASDCYRHAIKSALLINNPSVLWHQLYSTYNAWITLYLHGSIGHKLCALALGSLIQMAKPITLIRFLCTITDESQFEILLPYVAPTIQLLNILLDADKLHINCGRSMHQFLNSKTHRDQIKQIISLLENHPLLIVDELTEAGEDTLLNCIFSLRRINAALQQLQQHMDTQPAIAKSGMNLFPHANDPHHKRPHSSENTDERDTKKARHH